MNVYLRINLMFTDFQKELGLKHVQFWESVNIRSIPKSAGKNSNKG